MIGDHPERPFQTHELTADWTFVRFHYGHRGRKGNYSDRELETWARRIRQWRRRADVYAYFNNDWEGLRGPERDPAQEAPRRVSMKYNGVASRMGARLRFGHDDVRGCARGR